MKTQHSLIYRAIVGIGGFALLAAMGLDVIAVLGRYTGIPLLGSIELVQVMIAVAGAVALLITTLQGGHARVRLVLARLQASTQAWVSRVDDLLTAVFFLVLAIGCAWIMLEMWNSHEESELWRLPYRPLRVLVVTTLFATTLIVVCKAWRGDR
jgi:TRAP-type transport system small permease protein